MVSWTVHAIEECRVVFIIECKNAKKTEDGTRVLLHRAVEMIFLRENTHAKELNLDLVRKWINWEGFADAFISPRGQILQNPSHKPEHISILQ